MQAKLLRALQQKEIEKIGREQPVVVDVRIIAATNKNLQEQVEQKAFRADLLYRLNVVSLTLPPLRERLDDIGLLVRSFVDAYNVKYSKSLSVSPLLHAILQRHTWPGNIRELANILEYACIMCPGGDILPEHLPAQFSGISQVHGTDDAFQGSWREVIERTERRLLEEALRAYPRNRSAAIRRLGLSRKAFYDKLKRYRLD
jgi:Transcriptional regulator containing PAS, AAA-type ATPase, and DNA-binding domains